MANDWITHCKNYQGENECSWKEALTKAKSTYKKKTKTGYKKKDARDKKRLPKEVVELGGEKITIRKGGLHQSLRVPDSYKFTTKVLNSLKKVGVGNKFKFRRKTLTMTERMKKQIVLAINLMERFQKK